LKTKYTKIVEINDTDTKPVYHITVEKNHNFFANKLCVHNCDYRGEIKVILINHGRSSFIIEHGDRIAQGVMAAVTAKSVIDLQRVDEITKDTERGSGGFGSTGSA